VNLTVTDPMQILSVPTAFGLWDQMVGVALAVRYYSVAQRANLVRLNKHRLILLK
jgi:hypothetical protein